MGKRPDLYLLQALWWLFSPWYRRVGTQERASAYIAKVAGREGITSAQASALIWEKAPRAVRQTFLAPYREGNTLT